MTVRTLRANDIEMFDTIVMDAITENNARLFFVASHATGRDNVQEPAFVYEFEKATVRFSGLHICDARLTAEMNDGSMRDYGVSCPNGWGAKLRASIAAARGENVMLPCPVEAAMRHTRAIAMIRTKQPEAEVFPAEAVRTDNGFVWVPGLKDRLVHCYATCKML